MKALEFFAGSGLVRIGLSPEFQTIWANDNSAKKAAVYNANNPEQPVHLGSIELVHGADLPRAQLAWASFPCQDLSLAGNLFGIGKGTRSGLFWEWLRVIDELKEAGRRPPILVAENVVGFLAAKGGSHFKLAYDALKERGYIVGAIVADARLFLPQSRPRAFVVAVERENLLDGFLQNGPTEPFQPEVLVRAAKAVNDPEWAWWSIPRPSENPPSFAELCEWTEECDSASKTAELLDMLSLHNKQKLERALSTGDRLVGTGYRRSRPNSRGRNVQRLELRFDGIAGCLRTPDGGSSRQIVVIVEKGKVRTRLLSVRECARLMGAPESFMLPGSYNDGYRAMGDAVAVPVVRWLTKKLLAPLAKRNQKSNAPSEIYA